MSETIKQVSRHKKFYSKANDLSTVTPDIELFTISTNLFEAIPVGYSWKMQQFSDEAELTL